MVGAGLQVPRRVIRVAQLFVQPAAPAHVATRGAGPSGMPGRDTLSRVPFNSPPATRHHATTPPLPGRERCVERRRFTVLGQQADFESAGERLEPDERKPSCSVLWGGNASNGTPLPDSSFFLHPPIQVGLLNCCRRINCT